MKIYFLSVLAVFSLFASSCKEHERPQGAYQTQENKNEIQAPVFHPSHEVSKQNAPFSDAVQVGNTFYLAGQIGMDQKTRTLVSGGIQAETRQTLENIKAVLEHHGMSMANVVKALVVLDDIDDFAAFNEVYTSYLPQKPARTTFAAQALAASAKIEIEVIAVKAD